MRIRRHSLTPFSPKGIFILFTAALGPIALWGQEVSVSGQILSNATGQALPYANIVVKESGAGTFATARGSFRLEVSDLPVVLHISHLGFADVALVIKAADAGTIYLDPVILSGDEIWVTASKAIEGRSPVAFSNLTREHIEQTYSHQDVPMVLAFEPGTYAYSDAGNGVGYTYLSIRGFRQDHIGIYLNGIPLNDPESHAVYWVDHGDILASAVEVQVQRGVGSSLYGTSSFGGSVHMATSFDTHPRGFQFTGGYGNYTDDILNLPSRKLSLSYRGGPWTDRGVTVYGRVSDLNSSGYRIGSGAAQRSVHLGVEARSPGRFTKVEAIAGHEETAFSWDGISPQFGFDLNDPTDRRYNFYADSALNAGLLDANKDVFTQIILSAQHGRLLAGGLLNLTLYGVKGDGYYQEAKETVDRSSYNVFDLVPDTTKPVDVLRREWLQNGYLGAVGHYTRQLGRVTVTVGGDLRIYGADYFGEVKRVLPLDIAPESGHRYHGATSRKTSFSSYVRTLWWLRPTLSATLDLRHVGHRYSYDQVAVGAFAGDADYGLKYDFVDPHLGITYRPREAWQIYASISTGHREPAQSDIYIPNNPLTYFNPDPTIRPKVKPGDGRYDEPLVAAESLVDIELGGSYSSEAMKFQLNLYWMEFYNELIPVYFQYITEGNRLYANAPRTLHRGIEFSTAVRPQPWMKLDGSVSLADNRFVDFAADSLGWSGYGPITDYGGQVIPNYPALQVKGRGTVNRGGHSVWLDVLHVGGQYLDYANTESIALEPYTLLNLAGRLQLARSGGSARASVTLRVDNLLNTLYRTFGYTYYAPDLVAAYWPAATRSYFAELVVRF